MRLIKSLQPPLLRITVCHDVFLRRILLILIVVGRDRQAENTPWIHATDTEVMIIAPDPGPQLSMPHCPNRRLCADM